MVGWFALMAPAGTPPDVVARVNRDLHAVLSTADIVQRIATMGPIADGSQTVADVAQFLAAERTRWSDVAKEIGVLPE
jgi:tripartite-type tricarboxylate transporter receptor subunit TctC